MTQEEKIIARLQSLDNGLYSICIVIVNGEIEFWTEPEKYKVEGLRKEEPLS